MEAFRVMDTKHKLDTFVPKHVSILPLLPERREFWDPANFRPDRVAREIDEAHVDSGDENASEGTQGDESCGGGASSDHGSGDSVEVLPCAVSSHLNCKF